MGEVTDFNAWDRALTFPEMEEWTTCGQMGGGNLVDWARDEFIVEEMREVEVATEVICKPQRPGYTPLVEGRSFEV